MLPLLLLSLLASPAHAEPTEEDPSPYEARARPLLDGPPGCVEVRGNAQIDLVLVEPGG